MPVKKDAMDLLLMLIVLQSYLTFSDVKAVDPYFNYTCPVNCTCYKVNETSQRSTAWINCTVSHISSHLGPLFRQVSNTLISNAVYTCSSGARHENEGAPESTLWDGAFQNMPYLKALVFDNCKFKTLSKNGFRDMASLNQLIIRDATINDLDPDLLTFLPQLDVLEISSSALTHLFPLCAAGMIRVINITGNHIASMEHAGLHCSFQSVNRLETFDVSNNFLTEIPSWLSRNFPNLSHLRISNNHISQTDYSPFENLPKLTLLDINNNSFTRLHYNFFKGISNLHRLDMSMNKVSTFPRGLVSNLSTLQQLNIGDMDLDDKVWMEISKQQSITYLNMSNNRITSINTDIMRQFVKLQDCYLNNNRISFLPFSVFENQVKLKTLDLSFNEITEIPSRVFSTQYELNMMYLHHNRLTAVGYDSFSLLTELLILDISHNSISSIHPSSFHGLIKMTHFDVSNNNLTTMNPEILLRTQQVSYLNVSFNTLTEVGVMNQLTALKTIDFSYNRIYNLNPSFLQELRELTTFIISHNELTSIPIKLFKGCDNLQVIDMSYNFINLVDEATFSSTSRVQAINLSHNAITDIGTAFSGLKDLETLDLSYNSIGNVLRGQFPHFIKHLNLRGNRIVLITAHTFKSLSRIRTVDLSYNNLTSVNRMDLDIAFNMGHNPVFNLEFNPFACDCHLGWLKDWTTGKLKDRLTLPSFDLNSGLGCSSPFYNGVQSLQRLPRSEFLCSYTTHCEESCMCCDYACYCKYVCPASCRCFIGDDYLQVHHVQCSSANLTAVPLELPEGATDLRLDGNNIPVLHRHEFLALKHVAYLYLNNSQVSEIQNNTFKGLKSVRFLYLHDNYLTSIYSVTFQGLDSLEELFLQNNDIFSFDFQAFFAASLLRVVNLQGNALSSVPMEEILALRNRTTTNNDKTRMYLSGNPWHCDSSFACTLLSFVQTDPEFVVDISYVECVYPGINEKFLHLRPGSSLLLELQPQLCGMNQSNYGNMTLQNLKETSSNRELYALLAACVVIVFAVVILAALYLHRHVIQVFFFTRFGFRFFQTPTPFEDSERPYDAFISYSKNDEAFVIQQLVPRLENEDKKFQLCVHYRDFLVGTCIAESIVRSVEASKRTILVISNNYLNSEWCRFEFQTAHQQFKTEGRNRLIFLLMQNIKPAMLNDTLKVHLRARTYLKYDDPWFWEKLVYAMPDIRRRKEYMPTRLPCSGDLDYMAHERTLSQQHQWQVYNQPPGCRIGSGCEAGHHDMYEIPMLDSPNVNYHLANPIFCSTHTNSAYHSSGCSDIASGCHRASVNSSCYHQVPDNSSCCQRASVNGIPYNHASVNGSCYHHTPVNNTGYHPASTNVSCCNHGPVTGSCCQHGSVIDSCFQHGSVTGNCYHQGSVTGSCYQHGSVTGSCYQHGSVTGSCCHYEEVGPGTTSPESTPQKQIGTPPPVPLIPKEGFVPRQKPTRHKV